MIAMLHVETFFGDGDAFDSVGFHEEVGLEMLYPSQWMIQASLVMAWPSMLEGWLDGGLVKMFQRFYEHSLSGSHIFNMFIAKTRGFAIDHTVLSGKAIYKSTRRGMNMRSSFVHLYTTYASSHVTPSMTMAAHTVMLTLVSRYGAQYVFAMTTWHVWFAIAGLSLSPWLFHPQSFKEGMVSHGFVEWTAWVDFGLDRAGDGDLATSATPEVPAREKGSWANWNADRLKALRSMPSAGKFDYVAYRLLPVPTMLLFGACAALSVDDIMTKPILRGVVVLTAGVAGVLLSVIYHLATSPSFLWPRTLLDAAARAFPKLSVTDKHYVVFVYGLIVKAAVVAFHHLLCAHLFADAIDASDRTNQVIFFASGFFRRVHAGGRGVHHRRQPREIRVRASAHGAQALQRRDAPRGGHPAGPGAARLPGVIALPAGVVPARQDPLQPRPRRAALGTEMRRRRIISLINAASASKSVREYYLRARNFTRKVLGLRAIGVSFARPLPTTRPGLDHDLDEARAGGARRAARASPRARAPRRRGARHQLRLAENRLRLDVHGDAGGGGVQPGQRRGGAVALAVQRHGRQAPRRARA